MLNKRFTLNEIQLVYILIVKGKKADTNRQTYTNYNWYLHKLTKNLHITNFLLIVFY